MVARSSPLVFGAHPLLVSHVRYSRIVEEWLGLPVHSGVPGASLSFAKELEDSGTPSATAVCPEVRSYLIAHNVRFDPAAEENPGRAAIAGISLPILSRDGRDALMAVGFTVAALDGKGWVYHLRQRSDGSWGIVGRGLQWIS
jgi:hypothetical protein